MFVHVSVLESTGVVCVCVGIACTVCAHHVRGCLDCVRRTLNAGAAELCTAKRG